MKHKQDLSGTVENIFGHRFTLRTDEGVELADLTPHGEEKVTLEIGEKITIEGERKPSEIKVHRLQRGDLTVTIEHPKKHGRDKKHGHDEDFADVGDPEIAATSARTEGYEVIGAPRRKPKHFEVLGQKNGDFSELHVSLDGHIRHAKPIRPKDEKWQADIARSQQ